MGQALGTHRAARQDGDHPALDGGQQFRLGDLLDDQHDRQPRLGARPAQQGDHVGGEALGRGHQHVRLGPLRRAEHGDIGAVLQERGQTGVAERIGGLQRDPDLFHDSTSQ